MIAKLIKFPGFRQSMDNSIIKIPKKHGLIALNQLTVPTILAPDGSHLFVHVPQTTDDLRKAWDVLRRYTEDVAPNPESALQDLDEIGDVERYHFSPEFPYVVIAAMDRNGRPRAVIPAELAAANELSGIADNDPRRAGFIYQIGLDEAVSQNYQNFLVATGLYRETTGILKTMSGRGKGEWLGVVTESRNKGPELDAILKANFVVLIPNRYYKPPATQDTHDPENRYASDLILLGSGVPKGAEPTIAKLFTKDSYCEQQDVGGTLNLLGRYFESKFFARKNSR